MRGFYEFFAGGGMARAAWAGWTCLFANDFDARKSGAYRLNWIGDELKTGDVAALQLSDLPKQRANLAWASFPCQDLSLAGAGAGLKGARSGTFYPFWALIDGLIRQSRAPDLIVLENVNGALTSHGGGDFAALCAHLHNGGYRFGAMVVDAVHFVPHIAPAPVRHRRSERMGTSAADAVGSGEQRRLDLASPRVAKRLCVIAFAYPGVVGLVDAAVAGAARGRSGRSAGK